MSKYYCEGTIKTIALSVAQHGEMTITIEPTPSFKVTRSEAEAYMCLVETGNAPTKQESIKAYCLPFSTVIEGKAFNVSFLELLHLKDNKSRLGFEFEHKEQSAGEPNVGAPNAEGTSTKETTLPKCTSLIVL